MNVTYDTNGRVFTAGETRAAVAEALTQASDQFRKAAASLRDIDRYRSQELEGVQSRFATAAGAATLGQPISFGTSADVMLAMGALRAYIVKLGRVINSQAVIDSPIIAARMQQANAALSVLSAEYGAIPQPLGAPLSNPDEMNDRR